jgi:type IV pilus assembly protein PilE
MVEINGARVPTSFGRKVIRKNSEEGKSTHIRRPGADERNAHADRRPLQISQPSDNLSRSSNMRSEVITVQNVLQFRTRARGFTLIEVMITVAIIAILAAVAIPSYVDYVRRGYVVDATNGLATVRADMERYYQDNRTYAVVTDIVHPCAASTLTKRTFGNFVVACTGTPNATEFLLTATGSGPANSVSFTVNQANTRTSTMPSTWGGWVSCSSSWIVKKGQTC